MKIKIILIVFIVLGLSFTMFQVLIADSPKMMSLKEAEVFAAELYGGKVLKSTEENNSYNMSIENDKGIYQLTVDGETKKVSNVKLVEEKKIITVVKAKENIENELNGKVTHIKQLEKDGQFIAEATLAKDNKQFNIVYDLKSKAIVSNNEIKPAGTPKLTDPIEKQSKENKSAITKERALEIAKGQVKGQVTNVSKVTNKKGEHYKVTIDSESEVTDVFVQGNTGYVSSIHRRSKEQAKPQVKPQVKPNPKQNGTVDDDDDDNNDNNDSSNDNDDDNDDSDD